MKHDHELIVCIINSGFSEVVMDAARSAGARGGTVMVARGTANPEAEKLFKIVIQPEKETVLIIVPSSIRDDVLHAIYRNAGLMTEGQGIAFSLPVDSVIGLHGQENGKAAEVPQEKTVLASDEPKE